MSTPPPARPAAPTESGDRTKPNPAADNADSARTALSAVYQDHLKSMARNTDDSSQDKGAMSGDRDSITLAGKTSGLAEQMKKYLDGGGNFKDAPGKKLAQDFITALRQERDDHQGDRQTDQEYSGKKGMPEQQRQTALGASGDIAKAVKDLGDSKDPAAMKKFLDGVIASTATLDKALAPKPGETPGKDQLDAAKETKVIADDAKALQEGLKNGTLTPEQQAQLQAKLVADIGSKAGLIQRELKDIPNEINFAQHDSAAITAGADLEAVVRFALANHNPKSLGQLGRMLTEYHGANGQGTLDTVVGNRNQDLRDEPGYIKANDRDNVGDQGIIDITTPFKPKK